MACPFSPSLSLSLRVCVCVSTFFFFGFIHQTKAIHAKDIQFSTMKSDMFAEQQQNHISTAAAVELGLSFGAVKVFCNCF